MKNLPEFLFFFAIPDSWSTDDWIWIGGFVFFVWIGQRWTRNTRSFQSHWFSKWVFHQLRYFQEKTTKSSDGEVPKLVTGDEAKLLRKPDEFASQLRPVSLGRLSVMTFIESRVDSTTMVHNIINKNTSRDPGISSNGSVPPNPVRRLHTIEMKGTAPNPMTLTLAK